MPDEKGRPVRGEVGHPFYRKDLARGLKFDKKGNMISQGPPELDLDAGKPGVKGTDLPKAKGPKGTPDPRGIYTKAVAKGFNREEQINLLKAREIRTSRKDTEASLVAKILDSNPKDEPEEQTEPASPEVLPGSPQLGKTEKDEAYIKEDLEDFKPKKLVEILKGLGCKRLPLTEKGRIKTILELQAGGDSSA